MDPRRKSGPQRQDSLRQLTKNRPFLPKLIPPTVLQFSGALSETPKTQPGMGEPRFRRFFATGFRHCWWVQKTPPPPKMPPVEARCRPWNQKRPPSPPKSPKWQSFPHTGGPKNAAAPDERWGLTLRHYNSRTKRLSSFWNYRPRTKKPRKFGGRMWRPGGLLGFF